MWLVLTIVVLVLLVLLWEYYAWSVQSGVPPAVGDGGDKPVPTSGDTVPTREILRYRAVCPGCGARFSRSLYFTWLSHVHRRCQNCGCCYKADTKWEHVGSALLGLSFGACFLVGWLGVMSWTVAGLLLMGAAAAGCFLFPYVTQFVIVHEGPSHERPGRCGAVNPPAPP